MCGYAYKEKNSILQTTFFSDQSYYNHDAWIFERIIQKIILFYSILNGVFQNKGLKSMISSAFSCNQVTALVILSVTSGGILN